MDQIYQHTPLQNHIHGHLSQKAVIVPHKFYKPFKFSGVHINCMLQDSKILPFSVQLYNRVNQETTLKISASLEQISITNLKYILQISCIKPSPFQQKKESNRKCHCCKVVQRWSIPLPLLFHWPVNKMIVLVWCQLFKIKKWRTSNGGTLHWST